MGNRFWIALIVFVAVAIFHAVIPRYELTVSANGSVAHRFDRWTGRVERAYARSGAAWLTEHAPERYLSTDPQAGTSPTR